jgi:hypothetical protein
MNRMIRSMARWICAPALLLAALPATAQRVDPRRVLDVTLEYPDQVMSASIREGGTLNLSFPSARVEYEFVPVMQGRNSRAVTMAIYRMTPGQRSTRQVVERVNLAVGVPATLRTDPEITMVLDRIRNATPVTQASFRPASVGVPSTTSWRRVLQDGQCCVCCGDRGCACACAVKMSCGSCAMPGCVIIETSAPRGQADESARMAAVLGVSPCARPFPAAAPVQQIASR